MIAFLLGLLKIIGILLLIVLGLVLVIVGIVFFVPIRYQGAGQITEEKKDANVQITWLLKAVRCRVNYTYPEKTIISVKVLWIDVLKFLEKRKKKKGADTTEKSDVPEKETSKAPAIESPETPKAEETTETGQNSELPQPKESAQEQRENIPEEEKQIKEQQDPSEKKESLKEKAEKSIDKIKSIIYNIKYYIAVFQEEDTKQLIADAWGAIVKILKSIRPRVFEVNGEFGFATPDTTGQIYGAYCMVLPKLGGHIQLVPNFEEQILRGNLYMKGRITLFVVLINVLRILFDKRLQPLINKLKNGGNEDGRK